MSEAQDERRRVEGQVPVATVAKLMNITEQRLRQLAAQGWVPKPDRGFVAAVPCLTGYIKFLQEKASEGSHRLEQDARLRSAMADLRELELREKMGEVVQIQSVRGALERLGSRAGALLDGVGQSIAHEVIGKQDPREVAEIINRAIDAAREEIATLRVGFVDDPGKGSNGHGERVGRRRARAVTGKLRNAGTLAN